MWLLIGNYIYPWLDSSGPLLDVAVIVDGSTKSLNEFVHIRNFVKTFVSSLDDGEDWVHNGLVIFGRNPYILLRFGSLNHVQLIKRLIDIAPPQVGAPNLVRALTKIRKLFTVVRGYCPGASKVAVLVTQNKYAGGKDTNLQKAMQELRSVGVRLYVIVSDTTNEKILQTLVPDEDITRVRTVLEAEDKITQLAKHIKDQDKGKQLVYSYLNVKLISPSFFFQYSSTKLNVIPRTANLCTASLSLLPYSLKLLDPFLIYAVS